MPYKGAGQLIWKRHGKGLQEPSESARLCSLLTYHERIIQEWPKIATDCRHQTGFANATQTSSH